MYKICEVEEKFEREVEDKFGKISTVDVEVFERFYSVNI